MFEPREVHVMIDIEALDLRPTSAILSIAGVKFNPLGEPGKWAHETEATYQSGVSSTFYVNVDVQDCIDFGMTVGGSTVRWWLDQCHEARQALLYGIKPLRVALEDFNVWYGREPLPIWCNGASYDFPILREAYMRASWSKPPWHHGDERCYRTFRKLMEPSFPNIGYEEPSVPHDALHDAKAQTEHLQKLARAMHEMVWGVGVDMEDNYSPGPWILEDHGYKYIVSRPGEGYVTREVCRMDASTMAAFNQKANAWLIAAAPDLLVALREFREDWAHKLPGCSDPNCRACQREREFIVRVDAAIKAAMEGPPK